MQATSEMTLCIVQYFRYTRREKKTAPRSVLLELKLLRIALRFCKMAKEKAPTLILRTTKTTCESQYNLKHYHRHTYTHPYKYMYATIPYDHSQETKPTDHEIKPQPPCNRQTTKRVMLVKS